VVVVVEGDGDAGNPPGARASLAHRKIAFTALDATLPSRRATRSLCRSRFEMSGVKRLFQIDFTMAAGHMKMPAA
jgi:hypothetical protein